MKDFDHEIRVCSISPRLVETEFVLNLFPGEPEKAQQLYDSFQCLKPADVADQIKNILQTPTHVQIQDLIVGPTKKNY